VKLIAIGNSTGVVLPKDVLARLRVDRGDTLYVSEGPDGSFRLTPYDPMFEEQMGMAEAIMREDRDILRILAK
jgi:putative addiction module antidote